MMRMRSKPVEQVVALLKRSHAENDVGSAAPRIRREQLRVYLCARLSTARLAVIGEALGCRGGHFTGIAMTSERIPPKHRFRWIRFACVYFFFQGFHPAR